MSEQKKNEVILLFKLNINIIDILNYHNKYFKPISKEGLRAKLKRWLGEEEYKKIRQTQIKHPRLQKYYESKKRTTK